MSTLLSCAYAGVVVHKRLRPMTHGFSYRVFALALDVDEIDDLGRRLRLFSRNRWNLLSFYDTSHGRGDGTPVAEHVRDVLRLADLAESGARVVLVCYPRVLGFVFNPLSVYFCHRRDGTIGAIIYEVSNTFHERKCYVLPLPADCGGLIAQRCVKEIYVSPFTSPKGIYEFHVMRPGTRVVVGVSLRGSDGPVLKTYFCGERRPMSDWSIATLFASHPLMTLKVVAGIHFEALRLFLKGVPVVRRHVSPKYSFTVVRNRTANTSHVS